MKTVNKQKTALRHRRSKKAQSMWLPWAIGGSMLLVIVLVVGNNLRKPGTDEPGLRSYEALYGVQGTSINIGETEFPYPDPGNLGDGQKWLPALGSPDAPVTIIEFSDLFCGHCRTFNLTSLEGIVQEYVATGKVRYVDHFFGFGDSVQTGALEAMFCAAEQGHYFELKHTLFQAIEVNAFDIDRAARVSGLDMRVFNECVDSGRYRPAIQEMVYVDNMGVDATPTFFINGEKVSGNLPEQIRQKIEVALSNSGG